MRRLLKWSGGTVLVVTTLAVLFRGPLFRLCFHFEHLREVGIGASPPEVRPGHHGEKDIDPGIGSCIDEALAATAASLEFTTGPAPNDASGALAAHKANCVGYAAVFQRLCTDLLSEKGLSAGWRVRHVRGLLYCGTFNLHRMARSPFWRDHDICVVENRMTDQHTCVDPSLFDALRIRRVTGPLN